MKKKKIKKPIDLIPKPNNEHGYTGEELKTFLTKKEIKQFGDWINGQTCMMDGGQFIYYTHDVCRFIDMVRKGKATYWD